MMVNVSNKNVPDLYKGIEEEGEPGTSATMEDEITTRGKPLGATIEDIPGYIPSRKEGA